MTGEGRGATDGVVVVGAGPVGCTVALLLADAGVAVTVLERHPVAHPLPRAVHLDDEVVRVLHRVGVGAPFLARSRPATGLRLLDADHRVLAGFERPTTAGPHGVPYANMFHQPDLEQLLLDRVERHVGIEVHRGVEVTGLSTGDGGARVQAVAAGGPVAFPARYVLACDGGGSTVRGLLGVPMDDLGPTERWLVVDVRTDAELDPWGGVQQVCDPRRAATFMRVVGDRYRWEFALADHEDEADLVAVLGPLLRPWTGRSDLAGLELVRTAVYTSRAQLARRSRVGPVFLLGDAAHLTPPFIGQGLGAGLRDAANLAWKIAEVLAGRATEDLPATYETERRPHARALVRKAVLVGWAMTGGRDRAAGLRRLLLGLAVRSRRVRDAVGRPATPRLSRGALQRPRPLRPRSLRVGALVPNVLVRTAGDDPQRLDDVLAGRVAVLTAAPPGAGLAEACRAQGLLLVGLAARADGAATDLVLAEPPGALQALLRDPRRHVVVRPDGVVAAVGRGAVPRVPWARGPGLPASAPAGRAPGQ
jgi:3-(3-hydroxy-phenyl)propionate hydroxylase